MRSLAQFVMKGRRQAILAAVVTGAIPLISVMSPVIVALVILRHGLQEGLLVLAWALLPMIVWSVYPALAMGGETSLLSVLLLLGVAGLGLLLRATGSWQATVLASVAVGLLIEGYLHLQPAMVDVLLNQMNEILAARQPGVEAGAQSVGRQQLISVFAVFHAALAVVLLIWARWMQAMLYNPGGFKAEFHALRIEYRAAGPLVIVLLLTGFGILLPAQWYWHFAMPLLFAGVALVHATVALKQMTPILLFVFYMVLPVIAQLVVLLAVIDSWYDFRKNMRRTS